MEYKINDVIANIVEDSSKNKYGQYFTPRLMAEFMVKLVTISKEKKILEPSSGEGIFIDILQENDFLNIEAYEIDPTLDSKHKFVKNESFVSAQFKDKYDLIIGNPPYIRWKNLEDELKEELYKSKLWNTYFNSLCDYLYIFILKSIELLNENGELIFICPEYWMNTTHSLSLRNYIVKHGYFERIIHFNETPIFNNATVSVIVFKFIKTKDIPSTPISVIKYYKNRALNENILKDIYTKNIKNNELEIFEVPQFTKNKRWLLTNLDEIKIITSFEKSCSTIKIQDNKLFSNEIRYKYPTIGDICEIGNGMVSGLDKAFQLNGEKLNKFEAEKTIKVVKAKDMQQFYYNKITDYIFLNDEEIKDESEFKNKYPAFYKKLNPLKQKLLNRYQYNREIPYWDWVFLRNYKLFSSNKERILIPCKERISNKDYFRFALAESDIYPTQDVTAIFPKETTKESIYYILSFLNNQNVFMWLKNKGIVKGNIVEFSEKPISTIPFRKIDWENEEEYKLHDEIVALSKLYIEHKDDNIQERINILFEKLLN